MTETKHMSFHNNPKIKAKLLRRVRAHEKADEIIHGAYWRDGKGCAVGCTIHSNEHSTYESELGLPEWLARLEDRLFEGMGNGDAKTFPVRFLEAIPVGKDLETVKWRFCIYLMQGNEERVESLQLDGSLKAKVIDAIRQAKSLFENALQTGDWDESAAESAESAAWAAWAAESAAESAAWSAARAAESAAWSSAR